MRYYCDTNFIIRYLLSDNEEMFQKASQCFDQAQAGKITLIIDQTVFTETIFVLSSFYKVPKAKINEVLSRLLTYKGIEIRDKEALLQALNLYEKQNLHIVDCILVAKANFDNLEIKSFDQKLINIHTSNIR